MKWFSIDFTAFWVSDEMFDQEHQKHSVRLMSYWIRSTSSLLAIRSGYLLAQLRNGPREEARRGWRGGAPPPATPAEEPGPATPEFTWKLCVHLESVLGGGLI